MASRSVSMGADRTAALANSALPTILVATKCDNPESLRQIDTAGMAAAFPSCLADFKTSSNVPGSTRECLQVMLRAAVANRRGGKSDTIGKAQGAWIVFLDGISSALEPAGDLLART